MTNLALPLIAATALAIITVNVDDLARIHHLPSNSEHKVALSWGQPILSTIAKPIVPQCLVIPIHAQDVEGSRYPYLSLGRCESPCPLAG